MSENTAVDTVSGLDYEEIEEAVMETARGRWFLTEFARRQRASDTKLLLDAIRRLEDQLLAMPAVNASGDVSHLVTQAEDELHRLSGTSQSAGNDGVNARDLASRLAAITGNLRDALAQPADVIAEKIKPEIDRLDACSTQQDELADKLNRAAQMVRRLRSSDSVDDLGKIWTPEKQLSAPSVSTASEVHPVKAKPALSAPTTPAFVPSDDDIFESPEAPRQPETAAAPAEAATPRPATTPNIGSDTLNFTAIDVPPLPEHVSLDDDEDADSEATAQAAVHETVSAPAAAAPQAEPAPRQVTAEEDDDDDLPPEPDFKRTNEDRNAPDRVIQVTRGGSGFGQPPQPHAAISGSDYASTAIAGLRNPVAANPAPVQGGTHAGTTGNNQKKRIIVIRRPADENSGIPLAGDSLNGDQEGPGAA